MEEAKVIIPIKRGMNVLLKRDNNLVIAVINHSTKDITDQVKTALMDDYDTDDIFLTSFSPSETLFNHFNLEVTFEGNDYTERFMLSYIWGY